MYLLLIFGQLQLGMHAFPVILLLTYLLCIQGKKNDKDDNDGQSGLGRGFGDDINWIPWEEAFSKAKSLNKPVFLLIHKTWCGACQG
ncbi:unnamed protein product [Gongylonema pulchrum]|uniref:Thioredox_DsbH domain-containing protein n=1 Tax=Gongylonema pulchrum TaxID=637853 RepID=A0A183ENR8_9BILA|nr:unnamed protein product [Gongylonema pulchrum]